MIYIVFYNEVGEKHPQPVGTFDTLEAATDHCNFMNTLLKRNAFTADGYPLNAVEDYLIWQCFIDNQIGCHAFRPIYDIYGQFLTKDEVENSSTTYLNFPREVAAGFYGYSKTKEGALKAAANEKDVWDAGEPERVKRRAEYDAQCAAVASLANHIGKEEISSRLQEVIGEFLPKIEL